MEEEQPNSSTVVAGEDRISELPDEILHCIIRRIELCNEAGQTITLSKRWRRVWHSYPVVEYNMDTHYSSRSRIVDLQKFSDSAIERFSRDNLLRMETLKLEPWIYEMGVIAVRSPVVERLIDLALERKAEDVQILRVVEYRRSSGLILPHRLLFNSVLKSLRLDSVQFEFDNDFCCDSPTCLRSLYLDYVYFEDTELFSNLLANSPMLETLHLTGGFGDSSKLQVSKVTNLKTLEITSCCRVGEIEIVAPQLESLHLRYMTFVADFKLELTAPLLNRLEILFYEQLTEGHLQAIISKLPYLKYLNATLYRKVEKKLKLSSSSLVELELKAPPGLEELELDVGPGFEKLFLRCQWPGQPRMKRGCFTHELQKLEISNSGASCRTQVSYEFYQSLTNDEMHQWLVGFKSFIRSTLVHSVILHRCNGWLRSFDDEKVDESTHRGIVEHLKMETYFWSFSQQTALLDCLFWACQPKILTMSYPYQYWDTKEQYQDFNWLDFFDLKEFHGRTNWRHQFKDMTIEEGEKQICCSLTWCEL
ncbi:Putative F-box/LRR-repeat protein At3g28410 [Linum grandiflorum]